MSLYRVWYCGDLYNKAAWVVRGCPEPQPIFQARNRQRAEAKKSKLLKEFPNATYLICKMKD